MTSAAGVSVVQAHFAASIAASERVFAVEAERVADGCERLAARFAAGGTLFAVGDGAQASDARHVAVEFVHPILVGKRALPALALLDGAGRSVGDQLRALARPADALLVVAAGTMAPGLADTLAEARAGGLLTLVIADDAAPASADVVYRIAADQPLVAQEVAETLYHVIWELVHVFLEAGDAPMPSFVAADAAADPGAIVAHVADSTRYKAAEIARLRRAVLERSEADIAAAGAGLAARVAAGGRVLAFGNGGSATDAHDAAIDAMSPPVAGWRVMPALALTDDCGVVTAVGNDIGFAHVFARQIAAFGRRADVALAFSTSGASPNLLEGMAAAKARGLLTIALSGGDGGALARSPDVDVCITVPSEQLPRIQEAQATAWHALLAAAQERLR